MTAASLGMGFVLIIWILGVCIFALILHYVIRSAINSSEATKTLKEIRDLLVSKEKDKF